MNKIKYTMLTIFVVSAALILPALPAIADRDDKSEHPGLHKGWEKKHYGWEKKHDKKWQSPHDHDHGRRARQRDRGWQPDNDHARQKHAALKGDKTAQTQQDITD